MFNSNIPTALNCWIIAILASVALLASCKQEETAAAVQDHGNHSLLNVAVANYPIAYFAERIGGTEVNVIYRIPEEADPAFWEPNEKAIEDFQNADLILMNGATYSKWADTVSLPVSKVVDTSAAFSDSLIEVKNTMTHSHGKQGEHSHDGIAFTTWIDFNQALQQADAIREALQKLKPAQIELFALNFDLLKQDLLGLDQAMKQVGEKLAGRPIMASHPVYQYWAKRYQINLKSVLWEPEVVPTEEQMNELKGILADHPAKWFVWEGEALEASTVKLKVLGVESVVFNPCGNTPMSGNWLAVMKDNLANMQKMAGVE
ncbi:N/A [soil metagenome]